MADRVPTIDEIKIREKLRAYLETKPPAVVRFLALRAAVRLIPCLADYFANDPGEDELKQAALAIFRAVFVTWAAIEYPENDWYHPALNAAGRAAQIRNVVQGSHFAEALAYAARGAARSLSSKIARIQFPATDAILALNDYDAFLQASYSDLVYADENFISGIHSIPLWNDVSCPSFIKEMENRRVFWTNGWPIYWMTFFQIYSDFRNGDPFRVFVKDFTQREALVISIAMEGDAFWDRDPDKVMEDVSARLGCVRSDDETITTVADKLIQTPAAFRFLSKNERPIDAVPFTDVAINQRFAETTLAEAIEKAQELRGRLDSANADPQVMRSVERLLAVLPTHLDALNPALVRSKTRSLEASALAYAAAGAEAELSPNAVADLLDLVGTLKDLQGWFPQIAELERNTVAIDIAGREQESEIALSAITASARELSANYPGIITAAAVEAVAILDADIEDAPDLDVKRNLLAGSALIKHNFLTAFYRKILSPVGLEAQRVGKLHYSAAIDGSVEGTKATFSKILPATLAYLIGGPLVAAAVVLPDLFKSVKDAKDLTDRLAGEGKDGAEPW